MKYGPTEITKLGDWALIAAYDKCGQAQKLRDKASEHDKFNKNVGNKKKMEFPPINSNFTQMKNEVETEMKKRKLI